MQSFIRTIVKSWKYGTQTCQFSYKEMYAKGQHFFVCMKNTKNCLNCVTLSKWSIINVTIILCHFLQVVDLFVLLILHSTANRKKAMESLIRNKIKNGHFTEEMLSAAFNSHSQVGMRDILKQSFIQKL